MNKNVKKLLTESFQERFDALSSEEKEEFLVALKKKYQPESPTRHSSFSRNHTEARTEAAQVWD